MRRCVSCARRLRCSEADGWLQARELKKHIDSIRTDYKKMMKSKDTSEARLCALLAAADLRLTCLHHRPSSP